MKTQKTFSIRLILLFITILNLSFDSFGQFKTIKLKLPGDTDFRDYVVKQSGSNYLLNGDIEIPINPIPNSNSIKMQSYTKDDKHFLGITVAFQKWPDGRIPIFISPSVFGSCRNAQIVKEALDYMNSKTILRFVPVSTLTITIPTFSDENYVFINVVAPDGSGKGGSSVVGWQGRKQNLDLVDGFDRDVVIHELMHAVGILHEQARKDRDDYVNIDFSNIKEDAQHNYQKEPNGTARSPYDYCSVMHYPTTGSFAIDGNKPIITCKSNNNSVPCPSCVNYTNGLSNSDISGLENYYGINRFPVGGSFPMSLFGSFRASNSNIEVFSPKTQISTISRNPNQMDLFGVGIDGHVKSSWWNGGGCWHDWFQIGIGVFTQNTPLATICRNPNQMEIFGVGQDGHVYSAYWNGQWHEWGKIGNGVFAQNTPLTTICRNPNQMDIFGVGQDGHVYGAEWNGQWHDWVRN